MQVVDVSYDSNAGLLVIDDDVETLTAYKNTFLIHGFTRVFVAPDATSAKEILGKTDISVILLDLIMPDVDGLTLLPELSACSPSVSIIVVSGQSEISVALSCIAFGAADYLVKPVDRWQLVMSVQRCLDHEYIRDEKSILREAMIAGAIQTDTDKLQKYDITALGLLAQARSEFKSLLNTLPIPFFVASVSNDTCVSANSAYMQFIRNYRGGEGASEAVALPLDSSQKDLIRKTLVRDGGLTAMQITGRFEGQSPFLIRLSGRLLSDRGYYEGSFIDVTDLANLEKRLRTQQTAHDNSKHVSELAHDLRNILTGLLGYTQLVQYKASKDVLLNQIDQEMSENLRSIEYLTDRGCALAESLLHPARIDSGSNHRLDVNRTILNALKIARPQIPDTTEVSVNLSDELDGLVVLPNVALDRVLLNLIMNANEAITGVGRITVTSELRHGNDPAIPECFAVEVTDTGCGMSDAELERIFESAYTRKANGNGLGLAFVKRTIDSLSGKIDIDSEVGRGTRFRISIPVASVCEC